MKNQLIRERYAALTVISGRTLPSLTSINKVEVLLSTRFIAGYEATERLRKKIMRDRQIPPDMEGERLPIGIAEARQAAMDDMLEESTPIKKVPERLRLTADDLPKILKGDDGWKNAEGIAGIRVALGSLYVRSDDAKALDDATAELEPDELPPEVPKDDLTPESAE